MANPTAEQAKAPESKPAPSGDGKPASPLDGNTDLQSLPMPEVEKQLDTSPDGLTEAEAEKRLEKYGLNEIPEKKTNAILKFLSYF